MSTSSDKAFVGSIPEMYDRYLVPLIFEQYAAYTAEWLCPRLPSRVLEVAAGTGVLTRALASTLPEACSIIATDLNEAMLAHAAAVGSRRPVEWRCADALELPFDDGEFDAVVCQFGAMFFPDKARAFSEASRVLKPGGALLFSVWDRIEENDFAHVVTTALASLFPGDPPRFLARTPHGYSDVGDIERDLRGGGFSGPQRVVTLAQRSRAPSARVPAIAYCQGTPLRNEIESRGRHTLAEATAAATQAVADRFGAGAVDGKIQAHLFGVER